MSGVPQTVSLLFIDFIELNELSINLGSGLALVKRNFSAFDYLDIPLIRHSCVSEKDGTSGNVPDNGQASIAKSHLEDRSYLCRFHPCNEILMRLYEIFKTGKKQDLTPLMTKFSKFDPVLT